MIRSRLIVMAALGALLLGAGVPASARPYRVWFADELAQKADVVVMATVLSNRDVGDFSKGQWKPDSLVPVITTFGVDAVLKGNVPGNIRSKEGMQIEVTHMRYFDPMSNITVIDGASLTSFDAEKHPQYLLFLQGTGKHFVPLTGNYDDFQSFVLLGNYLGVAREMIPVAPAKPVTPETKEAPEPPAK